MLKKFAFISASVFVLFICSVQASAQQQQQSDFARFINEPSFKANALTAVADLTVSAIVIDGKRVREGNPILRDTDGTVAWRRAIPLKVATVLAPYLIYRWNRKWARFVMYGGAAAQGTAAGITLSYRF